METLTLFWFIGSSGGDDGKEKDWGEYVHMYSVSSTDLYANKSGKSEVLACFGLIH